MSLYSIGFNRFWSFECDVRLWPRYASALNNLAALLDNTTEAEALYRKAVRIQPCHANAHFSLGNLLRYRILANQLTCDHRYDTYRLRGRCDDNGRRRESDPQTVDNSRGTCSTFVEPYRAS